MKVPTVLKYCGKLFILMLLTQTAIPVFGDSYYFYVQFSDKNNSPYSLANPSEYLSARSIERREHRGSAFDSTDLPINPAYLTQIESLGIHVHSRSKWMNGATVVLSDSNRMSLVRLLPFVKFVRYTGRITNSSAPSSINKLQKTSSIVDYGYATTQIDQLNGRYLHNLGYRGKGIVIGVLDAGFNNVNINHAFDSLRLQDRLLGTKDIINPNSNIFAEDTHGANVLSTMAGNLNDQYVGTAPDASYWLIRTEYGPTEYLVETDFWCAGIEFADSVGVDIVNSSLGYTEFDDASMNFTYAQMNGISSRASQSATLAANKGIIVCNSAGNNGNKAWRYISVPADAKGIITVGAITADKLPSSFSSWGPSFDRRTKPEICSLGSSAAVVSPDGLISYPSGTSFSSPIIAGMMACFLQASKTTYSACNIDTLLKAVFESASLYASPTEKMGYGIPNFQTALAKLPFSNAVKVTEDDGVIIAYNRHEKSIHIRLINDPGLGDKMIRIYSTTGSLHVLQSIVEPETVLSVKNLKEGMYIVNIAGGKDTSSHKVIIR